MNPETAALDPLDRSAVERAAARIAGRVHRTPVLRSRSIDALLGARFFFKCENFQRMGAFKIRGAMHAVQLLPDSVGVVATHSSGNHGAALALAAAESGRSAHIVVPADARPRKRAAIERYGATVVECEPTLASREETLAAVVQRTGAVFVPPYDDARIIAGAGTAALELLEDCPDLDQIWAPVGGGGLAAGTVLAAAGAGGAAGAVEVVLAEPELARDAKDSLAAGAIGPPLPPITIADGLRTGLGQRNFAILAAAGVRVQLASEAAIERWTQRLAEILKIVVEPSAAVTLAAIEEGGGARGNVGIILSGGNR